MTVAPPRIVAPDGRIIAFRALAGLGDFLCIVPALRAIRRRRPDVEITLAGLPASADLVRRFGDVIAEFLPFPGFPGLPEQEPDVRRLPGFLATAHARSFDLAIQLHGSGRISNLVTALLGARRNAGHHPETEAPPDPVTFRPWRESVPEVRRAMRLVASLGFDSDDEGLAYPLDAAAEQEFTELAASPGGDALRGRYVVLHAGASAAWKCWPASSFAAVGDTLAEGGLGIVLTGTEDERPLTAEIAARMRHPPLDLAGRTSLDGVAGVVAGAALVICNDTGISHLAAALRVPSVVVFRRASDIERWAPLDRRLHRVTMGDVPEVLGEASHLLWGTQPHAA